MEARLPRNVAVMYRDWRGEWQLPPLNGVAAAPLLQDDGTIKSTAGYDVASGMWCENVPNLTGLVPDRPTRHEAEIAFRLIRGMFSTLTRSGAPFVHEGHWLWAAHIAGLATLRFETSIFYQHFDRAI